MSSKERLCAVCGKWIPEGADLVILADSMGVADLECAWNTRNEVPE